MMNSMAKSGMFVLILVLVSGCNLVTGPAEIVPTLGPPGAAETPGSPPADSPAATPSATWTIAASDTPSGPIISVSVDTNCRRGPGKVYDYLGALPVGETAEVLAKDPTGKYWYIRNPDGAGYCWLWGEYATLEGDTGPLPVYTPEPTPTPVPDFTFEFKAVEACVTFHLIEFKVTNTGAVTWESYNLYVEDITLSLDDAWSDDIFADVSACGVESYDLNLDPGEVGALGSRPFINHYPHGESFFAELTLCTMDGMAGQCLTKTMTFTVP